MARVRVEWIGGNVSDFTPFDFYQFALVGSSAVVFPPTLDNRCGAIPDELNLTLSGGEAGEGNVCFELPQSETDLILIYGHEENARWLRLPEN